MLRVGLTGGTGSGKSTVARRLAALGAVVVDADLLAREVVAPGSAGLAAVVAAFGAGVQAQDGSLDRPALARLVFGADEQRRALEAITHPLIAARTTELIDAAPADAVVVHDVPLLVEKAMGAAYHLVVMVDAPVEVRVGRLAQRGMAADDARARIRAQATDEQRRAAADVWLDNGGSDVELMAAVHDLWHQRLVPFERNVRTGVRVQRASALALVPSDPTWPAQAARLAARIARAAGERGRGVEHIGSTSVPGLVAKEVIDLQLGVDTLADADAVRSALVQAGFPHVAGNVIDNVHAEVDPDPRRWRKRFHGGADPARVVHLHVREVDGPGWRTALLLRDWWRADPAERAVYGAEKRRLAALGLSATAYAAAKEPWFAQALPRALAWATHPLPPPDRRSCLRPGTERVDRTPEPG